MQSVSSRIWTRVAVSISYDDNLYTTGVIGYNQYEIRIIFEMILLISFFCIIKYFL